MTEQTARVKSRARTLLGPEADDAVLEEVVSVSLERLLSACKGFDAVVASVPESLEFIAVELSVARYNAVGSEGMTSESVEGWSGSYVDVLDRYLSTIKAAVLGTNSGNPGKVIFL